MGNPLNGAAAANARNSPTVKGNTGFVPAKGAPAGPVAANSSGALLDEESAGPDVCWHAVPSAEDVYMLAETSLAGLTDAEATRRASVYGPNMMTMGSKRTMWQKIWEQVNNMIMYILIVSATVSGGFEEWEEVRSGVVGGAAACARVRGEWWQLSGVWGKEWG